MTTEDTQGDSLEEVTESAREALALYVEGLSEDGGSLEMGIVRRKLPLSDSSTPTADGTRCAAAP